MSMPARSAICAAMHAAHAKRVACLLPSASETLAFIGGQRLIVGRSHECDFPPSLAASDMPVLTRALNAFESSRQMNDAVTSAMASGEGLYAVDADALRSIRPEVVLTQSLCSVCSIDANVVTRIAAGMPEPRPAVVTLNPMSLQDVIADCITIGDAVGLPDEGRAAAAGLTRRMEAAVQRVKELASEPKLSALGKTVAFLEWTDPLFPGGHWTPQLIELAGGRHPINPPVTPGGAAMPSAEIPIQAVVDCDPYWIILCPCGLSIEVAETEALGIASAPWWKGLRAVQEGRVVLVDGNHMFNRPGPRLVDALEWLVGLLHERPDLMPKDFPWKHWVQPDAGAGASVDGHAHTSTNGVGLGVGANQSASAADGDSAHDSHANGVQANGQGGECGCAGGVERGERLWCAPPGLPPDIEEAHEAACAGGKSNYVDPRTGYLAFTEEGLLRRGYCCGNRCRHCPWGHLRVTKAPRVNLPSAPLLLDAKSLQRCVEMVAAVTAAKGSGNGVPEGSAAGAGMASAGRAAGGGWVIAGGDGSGGSGRSGGTAALQGVVLLAWQGGDSVPDLVSSIRRQNKVPILLAAFARDNEDSTTDGAASASQAPPLLHWTSEGQLHRPSDQQPCGQAGADCGPASPTLRDAQEVALKAGLPLLAVPVVGSAVCWSWAAPKEASQTPPGPAGALSGQAGALLEAVLRAAVQVVGQTGQLQGLALQLSPPLGVGVSEPLVATGKAAGLELWQ